ncbi:MAG: hypothetical protein JNL72_09435 [Flavipsychrobacter sp.]|nr:hypothetical protein [Flavipsychrobacter sp.]
MMKKMLPILSALAILALMSSCEKGYVCECAKPGTTEKEVQNITAANLARAEVKCMQMNTAGPNNKNGFYNCSLNYTDK